MPIVYERQEGGPATKIGVWHITETEAFFAESMPLSREISHAQKRLQHLAGRYLLRQLFPQFPLALIEIADTRKPFLPGEPFHFSISHCRDFAAAIVSRDHRVGIDLELPQPKIETLQQKFLSPQEQALLQHTCLPAREAYTLGWSIKEALFKWYGSGNMDFIGHLQIDNLQHVADAIVSECRVVKDFAVAVQVKSVQVCGAFLSTVMVPV